MYVSRIQLPRTLSFVLLLVWGILTCSRALAAEPGGMVTGCLQVTAEQSVSGVASLWDAGSERIPDPRRFIIIPTAVASLQADGCFTLQAPPGSYYVGAILRDTPGAAMGPPRAGDRVFMTPAPDGTVVRVEVMSGATVDVGLRTAGWLYQGFSAEVETGVRGRVIDADGQPVGGLLVFAFADPEMSGAPLAVSERSTAKGAFQIRLDRAGEVFLRVKENYGGGAPSPGGYVGVYGGETGQPVKVTSGEVIDVLDIAVMQVPLEMFKRRGPYGQSR